MAILGWLVIVGLALFFSAGTLMVWAQSSRLRDFLAPGGAAIALWAAAYTFAPFTVVLNP